MSRSGVLIVGLGAVAFASLGVASASCLNTSGLVDGPEPTPEAAPPMPDTSPPNPNPCGKDLQNDIANCGTCGNVCGFGANSFPLCTAGVCKIGCNNQYGNCDNDDKNGCEAVLTSDPLNCNVCGRSCGGPCTAGQCGAVNLAPKIDGGVVDGYPVSLAMDATSLFCGWYSPSIGYEMLKIDKTTGATVPLGTGPLVSTQFLAADDDPNGFVYFVRPYGNLFPNGGAVLPTSADGAILKLAKTPPDAGIGAPLVFVGSSGPGVSGGVFVDANAHVVVTSTGIYFSAYGVNYIGFPGPAVIGAGVFRCPATGSCPTPAPLAPTEYGAAAFAVDGTTLVFDNQQTDAVITCPIGGCDAGTPPIQSSTIARFLFEDAANYYWLNTLTSAVVKVDRATNTATVLAPSQPTPYGFAIDDKNVYWTTGSNPGTINSCAIAGCASTPTPVVALPTGTPRTLLSTPKALYWITTGANGGVFKLVK